MTETIGTDLVRAALRGRNRKLNMAGFARDLGLASDTLDAFANARIELAPEMIQKLVRTLWGGSTDFDAEANALRPPTGRRRDRWALRRSHLMRVISRNSLLARTWGRSR